jgi:hypothetical protein
MLTVIPSEREKEGERKKGQEKRTVPKSGDAKNAR